jgi:hypothetical protein
MHKMEINVQAVAVMICPQKAVTVFQLFSDTMDIYIHLWLVGYFYTKLMASSSINTK